MHDRLFPANWLSAHRDDNRKSCILNGDRFSCPVRNVNRLMSSYENKWRDVTQNVCHSSVYTYINFMSNAGNSEMEYVINRL